MLENVTIDPVTRELDFDDASNDREHPRRLSDRVHSEHVSENNLGPPPSNVIMLTADAFGVLPPIARLTPDQAMYHFLSGYTAKVAGTEIGVTEPQATFSTCFGAPFMPRHPSVYGNLLQEAHRRGRRRLLAGQHRLDRRQVWRRQAHADQGNARAARTPRSTAASTTSEFRKDPNFGFEVPVAVPGVDTQMLDPRSTWADKDEYDRTAAKLVDLFVENFAQFADQVDEGVRQAAPKVAQQAHKPTQPHPLSPVTDRAPRRTRSMTEYRHDFSLPTPRSSISAKGCSRARCPRAEWTHEAHLAATTYLLAEAPRRRPRCELPGIIRRFNESVGGVNSDTEGYHETITRVFLHGVRLFLAKPTRRRRCTSW